MGTQKYGAFCVSFMLNASLSHFLPHSDSIFQFFILFYFIFVEIFPFWV